MILLLCLLVSVVVYQLYRDNDKHYEKLSRWKLENPARSIAISVICFYGTYILFVMVSNLVGVVMESISSVPILYDALYWVFDIVIMLVFWCGYMLMLSAMVISCPLQ